MTTTLELPDHIANAIKEVPEEHLAKHIIGKSGFTIAKEDEILRRAQDGPEAFSKAMTPEEYLQHLDQLIDASDED